MSREELRGGVDKILEWIGVFQDAVRTRLSTEMFEMARATRLLDMLLDATGVQSTGVTREMFEGRVKRYFAPLVQGIERSAAASTTGEARRLGTSTTA
jgi:hypothetical protein